MTVSPPRRLFLTEKTNSLTFLADNMGKHNFKNGSIIKFKEAGDEV